MELDDTKEAARQRVAAEIADPHRTLRRVRLALGYAVPFNQDALNRHLTAQKARCSSRVGSKPTDDDPPGEAWP